MEKRKTAAATGWLAAGCTLLLAGLLIAQCLSLYTAGVAPENFTEAGVPVSQMYTREAAAEKLGEIAWAAWLWLASVAAALIGRRLSPGTERGAADADLTMRRELLAGRREETEAMRTETRRRRRAGLLCAAVYGLCAAFCAAYLLNPGNFRSWELDDVLADMLLHIGPWMLIAFAAAVVRGEYDRRSLLREIEAAKTAPVKERGEAGRSEAAGNGRTNAAGNGRTTALRIGLLAAAAGLIAAGVMNGGMYDVLVKAINICTECIGLG